MYSSYFFLSLPFSTAHRLSQSERQKKADPPLQDIAANLYSRNRVQELERAKAEVEKKHEEMKAHYESELNNLRKKYDGDVAQLKASTDERVQAAMKKLLEEVSRLWCCLLCVSVHRVRLASRVLWCCHLCIWVLWVRLAPQVLWCCHQCIWVPGE